MNKQLTELQIKLLLELEEFKEDEIFSKELDSFKENLRIDDIFHFLLKWCSVINDSKNYYYKIEADSEGLYSGTLYVKDLTMSFPVLDSIYPSLYNCQGYKDFYGISEPLKVFTENIFEVYHLLVYTLFNHIFSYIVNN